MDKGVYISGWFLSAIKEYVRTQHFLPMSQDSFFTSLSCHLVEHITSGWIKRIHLYVTIVNMNATELDIPAEYLNPNYHPKEEEESLDRLSRVAKETGLKETKIVIEGRAVIVLQSDGLQPVSQSKMDAYVARMNDIKSKRNFGDCFDVARETCAAGVTTARAASYHGATPLTGFDNHCVNFDQLEDGTVATVDLTGEDVIDNKSGKLDILIVHVADIPTLIARLNDLYGGDWRIIPPDNRYVPGVTPDFD
jgi:hypothetical protein